ncbi:MAG: undecaprenyl-phosphate galactose phosphotransferase WbaP [Geminicoccaceae bacterium]|nr:undecaprenyl-phosphate galactose phosphotransferase WbaP [Geminicoccaceae bacterium]
MILPLNDVLTMLACFALSGLLSFSYPHVDETWAAVLVLLVAGCIVVFQQLGHYSRRRQFWQEVGDVILAAGVSFLLHAALLYLLKINFSRLWMMTSWVLIAFLIPLSRQVTKRVSLSLGGWKQRTVIVGTGEIARETASIYAADPHLGYDVVAFIDPWQEAPARMRVEEREVPVHKLARDDVTLPSWLGRPHVVVALDLNDLPGRETLIEKLSLYHGDIDVISPVRGLPISNARVSHFFSYDILSLRICNNLARPWSQVLKRAFDIVAASAMLVFLAPLLGVIALLVRSGGAPVVFAHTRVGRHGRLFQCLKFRTMVPDARTVLNRLLASDPEARAEWERSYKLKDDPRITAFGAFLRKTSLDELPQLWNVLRGDMSLVGPRPVVADEIERYGDAKAYYYEVRPGLTGLWQISGRSDLDYDRRISLDTWYVRNWTLWYDVLILFKTLLTVPAKAGAY